MVWLDGRHNLLDFENGLAAYHRDDAWHADIATHFEYELRRMAALAGEADVPLLFVLPPSNLADSPPFNLILHSAPIGNTTEHPFHWHIAILPRTGHGVAETLEGQVVRLADIVAYVNHDLDDAMRAGLLEDSDVPASIVKVVGSSHAQRIGSMVRDIIVETLTEDDGNLHISEPMLAAIGELRSFLYDNVYRNLLVHREFEKAQRIITELYGYFLKHGLVRRAGDEWTVGDGDQDWAGDKTAHRLVCDYIAGMTDNYAISVYEHLFMPSPWSVR